MSFLQRTKRFWSDATSSGKRLVQIEYLRGLAALMVVFQHIIKERPGFFSPFIGAEFGRAGVMIFFVISGFVMMYSCRGQSPRSFLVGRITRIVPLYWTMTILFFAITARQHVLSGDIPPNLSELLRSLFFFPHYHPVVTDRIWPLLVPGWTLNFEMFFFLIFLLGLVIGRVETVTAGLLACLVGAGLFADTTHPGILTWTSPLLLLFLSGMALAKIWGHARFRHLAILLPVGWCLTLAGSIGWTPFGHNEVWLGVAAVTTVAGALALQARGSKRRNRSLLLIGDASYSTYLSHTILMIFLYKLLGRLSLDGWPQFIFVTLIVMTACTIAGIAIHLLFDKPVTQALRDYLDPRSRDRKSTDRDRRPPDGLMASPSRIQPPAADIAASPSAG